MRKTSVAAIFATAVVGIAAAQVPGASPSQSQAPAQAQVPPPPTAAISAQQRDAGIDAVANLVESLYVDPDLAKRMAADLRQRKGRGEYSHILTGQALASALLAHLRAVSNDKHLGLTYSPQVLPQAAPQAGGAPNPNSLNDLKLQRAQKNYGFPKVEVLEGNIGYLRIDGFDPPELNRDTIAAAFAFLANVDALIIDLRENTGGAAASVALLASYLFNDSVHLNDIYNRTDNTTTSFYTDPQAAAVKLPTQKVYLLTSFKTFSAGEGFVYHLQALKRAQVIGEATGGGAHPTAIVWANADFVVALPASKAVNPITKTNWEGKGVQPDVHSPASRALDAARVMALEDLIASTSDPARRAALQQALARAKTAP